MPIPTSRNREDACITIDAAQCNGCGLCVDVCKDFSIIMKDGKAIVSGQAVFGCIGCGHCMAICPEGAIKIEGRFTSPEDLFPLPDKAETASYESLLALFQRRRSIREYKDKPVEQELVEKIIAAASTAPMGIPPTDVNILVINGKEKAFQFSKDYCEYLVSLKWMVSPLGLIFMRMFYGKENGALFRDFIKPLIEAYDSHMKRGENIVTYDAPLVLYFYGSTYNDPADPLIAATYAMTAAESLGLGTCMIGGVHPFIQSGKAAEKFRQKYGIRYKSKEGLMVIVGYPRVKYRKGITRTFANIDFMN